ncbi:MAG TPA: hypothetical protein VGY58_23565, partial [Gemmataceae bacterium]|nr:hypothetical protein [Gemmataceae bacterium]
MRVSFLLVTALLAVAQPAEDDILARISINGESGRTARRLIAVDKLLEDKKWPEAIDELQRILSEAGDDLVPVDNRHCMEARRLCHVRLAALPPDALRLYRGRVDSQAKKWLDEGSATRDATLLRRLVDETFCSRFTEQALDLLGDLAFERGAFAEAEHWWQMLARPASYGASPMAGRDLLVYPDPHLDIAQVRAKELMAPLLLGELAAFQHELPAFQAKHGAASGHL